MPELAFISLGSNIEPEKSLPLGTKRLGELGRMIGISTVYQNPAVGPTPQPDFLNAAALIETDLSAKDIRHHLRRIEADSNRVRTQDKYAPRTLDLDLCLLGSQVIEGSEFTLPDPDLLTRAHLAVPMAELAPSFLHPTSGETLQTIADRLRPEASLKPRPELTDRLRRILLELGSS
ncbi:MAG TPA: 2-amino-4-hydroxy-6-hydroxymethyldihydropteridine diphosphokinase [Anaerolineae bacterium]|nr:2-amino-4-hydroxy-6-hydroxymethyldihydropteridine diphosphokinase [Anaerolineae bacterium]